ncbi:primosomal protein N', partial [Myxococcota bacterium]|nr:primosomal protein N' [Myxococcota bacterium]
DFGRKRTIREVWAKLALGAVPVEELVSELGKGAKVAIAELEARGLVARRKVASDAARRPVPSNTVPSNTVPSNRSPACVELQVPPPLMPEQATALDAILGRLEAHEAGAFLLHGVTASGKTEVYLRAIAHVLAKGQGAIVLVPEIALTPQLESRFRARFGDQVAVLHSALTETERRRRWQRLRRGDARIALGPRSAIWAPVRDLAIIVVDEEHDPSFKQGSDVRYNGRDLALVRAHQVHGVAVLGSATPSLESLQLVVQGKLTRLRMKDRVAGRPLPTVEVVDLAEERSEVGGEPRVLTRALADRLRDVVAKKGQAILFLNRRGFNTIVFCADCGAARHCSKCDVSLTHHKAIASLVCHYCGHVERLDAPCRECKGTSMQPFGVGTQRVAEAVTSEVPDARVLRLDRDVTSNVGELDRTLDDFRQGKADVLVGTQMVAKGHDFPGVVLVGIVLADASLAFPDFRAAERTFQLLTQVAGRAGRAENPGHVIIQTFQRNHHALTSAIHHDTDGFFAREVESRRELAYPPFGRLGIIRFESREERALKRATEVAARAAQRIKSAEIRIQGPVEAPIAMIRERHRELMLVKAPTPAKLTAAMRKLRAALAEVIESKVDVIYDVDPVDLL